MSASTSSSPAASNVIPKPEISTSAKRGFTFWRPLLACGGALLVGAILVRVLPEPTTPTTTTTLTLPEIAAVPLVLSKTQLVEARLVSPGASGRTMPGQWKLTTDMTGKATASGEVARWVVEPGTHVEAGQSVVEISSGAASRPASRAEAQQDQAEKEQVAAANGQSALAQKLTLAQNQLVASQERVAQAQAKVATARSLVKRLLAGEKIPVAASATKPVRQTTKRANPEFVRLDHERRRAEEAASDARDRADGAKSELNDAKKALAKAQKQSDTAAAALTKAENDFKAEKTTADVMQNARADADDAQSALKAAQTRADVAQRAFTASQDKVSTSEVAAKEARSSAEKVATAQSDEPAEATSDDKRYMTADQAATLVSEALQESKAAARQADRVHARVEDYQRQVRQSSDRIEEASQDLQKAQQNVLDSVPRPQFTAATSPVEGTITWISRLAREVGVGQAVFGISQGRNAFLRFEDTSGAWKAMRVGQTLQAASAPAPSPTPIATSSVEAGSPPMPTSKALAGNTPAPIPIATAAPFTVRITRITAPTNEGEPAQIDAVRTDGGVMSTAEAATVQAQIPLSALPVKAPASPSAPQHVVVPLSVILPRDGTSYVAVVESTTAATTPATLQWRPVKIEQQSAFDVEIKSGLKAGEHVVSQPILLLSELKPEEKKGIPVVVEASD